MPNGRILDLQHVVLAPRLSGVDLAAIVAAAPAAPAEPAQPTQPEPPPSVAVSDAAVFAIAAPRLMRASAVSFAKVDAMSIRPALELLRPELFRPQASFPREASTHPIAASAEPNDTQLFESADGATRYWLPRYRVRTAAQGRYQVGVVADPDGRWVLSIGLEAFPAPEVATAAQTAVRLPHTLGATLRFTLPGTTVERRLAVDEIVQDAGGPVAILRLALADRDDVLGAFMARDAKAVLEVQRQYTVAVPTGETTPGGPQTTPPITPVEVDTPIDVSPRLPRDVLRGRIRKPPVTAIDPQPDIGAMPMAERVAMPMRRLDIAAIRAEPASRTFRPRDLGPHDIEPVLIEPPRIDPPQDTPPQDAKPLYREAPQHQPHAVPLWFDRTLHPYIYPGGTPDAPAGAALNLVTVAWAPPGKASRNHAYFQSVTEPSRFWYLPDAFRLTRTGNAPFTPALAFVVDQGDGADGVEVELIADVRPVTDGKRLLAARDALAAKVPATGTAPKPVTLEPLLAKSTVRLGLPRDGRMQQVTLDVQVDLANGFQLSDRFPMSEFQDVFAALTAEQPGTLLRGTVAVSTGMGGDALIPVEIDVRRMQGELFEYLETFDAAAGTVSARLRNQTGGALSIPALPVWLARGDAMAPAVVRGIDFAQPVRLEADAELVFEVAPLAPWPADASGVADAVFDTSAIVALPDPEVIFKQTFDNSVEQDTLREITVMTDASVMAGDGSPNSALRMIILEFAGNKSVKLTATNAEQTVQVPVPLMDILLRRDTEGRYRFRQTLITMSGTQRTDPHWRESDLAVLFAPVG